MKYLFNFERGGGMALVKEHSVESSSISGCKAYQREAGDGAPVQEVGCIAQWHAQ